MKPARVAAVAASLLLAGVLSACAPDTAPAPPADAGPTEAAPSATPSPSSTDAGDADAADPTCETIILRSTAADFQSLGWTAQTETFRIGATEVRDGILCKWSDGSATADRVQMFGWAPVDESTAAETQTDLVSAGWKREEGSDGEVYVTENPDWLGGRGVDGYGITYLFGDGWVKVADTKQSLVLIDWPPAQR